MDQPSITRSDALRLLSALPDEEKRKIYLARRHLRIERSPKSWTFAQKKAVSDLIDDLESFWTGNRKSWYAKVIAPMLAESKKEKGQ